MRMYLVGFFIDNKFRRVIVYAKNKSEAHSKVVSEGGRPLYIVQIVSDIELTDEEKMIISRLEALAREYSEYKWEESMIYQDIQFSTNREEKKKLRNTLRELRKKRIQLSKEIDELTNKLKRLNPKAYRVYIRHSAVTYSEALKMTKGEKLWWI